ncbi:Mu transposase C-terminal domain-containing protein [Nitrosomonas halophila]|uniref:Putative transposase n=1 Tax=Nitrosomonas halophila TaxID=44576 RepID=A0A1H3FEX8_9PROT|nr:Mu transposase C-terminal domain-containing protein [Nitrosomonas halophila]SDX89516.1 putative transposase [Nitrosomonas halophila]
MSETNIYYTCYELAAMQLPGLPSTEFGMLKKAKREKWVARKRPGNNGYEYLPPVDVLVLIRDRVLGRIVSRPAESEPARADLEKISQALKPAGDLKVWQREVAAARLAICEAVQCLASKIGKEAAILEIVEQSKNSALPETLQAAVEIARAKKMGQKQVLSRASVYRWLRKMEQGQGTMTELAPHDRSFNNIPAWAPALLRLYSQPQKPSLLYCHEQLLRNLSDGVKAPSYRTCMRFIEKMSNVDQHHGRMGSRQIKNILPFVRRDTRGMWPAECYTADGHTFDAEVAHPAHGRAFRPEITTVLDVATRKVVGFSIGLAESSWTVLDALRHACLSCSIPSIFYVDNGTGFKNDMMNNEVTGFMARLGIQLTHSLPYASQARGLIERVQQSIWVRAAKTLPTYMGKDMDPQAKQRAFKVTRKEVLQPSGRSKLLIEWPAFIAFCQSEIDRYNDRAHSSLPKIVTADGVRRHQSPNDAWAQAISEGWQAVEVAGHDRNDLFRPYKTAKTTRGEIRLFGNRYFSHDLAHYHGETMRVGYDIHDASRVWVRDREGRLVAIAEFEANSQRYFPQSFIDQANYKRAQARIKRAEARIEEAQAELDPPLILEHQPAETLPPMPIKQSPDMALAIEAEHLEDMFDATNIGVLPTQGDKRPWFTSDAEKYRWLMHLHHRGYWTQHDIQWLRDFVHGEYYWDMKEIFARESIVWTSDDDHFAERKLEKLQKEEKNEEDESAAAR